MNTKGIKLLNVRQAAEFLNVNPFTIRRWAKAGRVTAVKIGTRGDWRFTEPELAKTIRNGTASPSSEKGNKSHAYKKQGTGIFDEFVNHLRTEHLKLFMDVNPSLIFIKDEKGRYVYLNRTYEKNFVRFTNWYGKTDFDFWPKKSAELFRSHDAVVRRSGKTEQFLEDSRDRFGRRYCWLCYKFPFTDFERKRYIGGIGIDVTEQVQAEEALQESKDKYQSLIETMSDFIWEMDNSGRYTYCSPQMEKLWGLKPEDMVGKTPFDLVPEEMRHGIEKAFRHIIRNRLPIKNLEVQSYDGSGKIIIIEVNGIPYFDRDGKLLGYRGITRDITIRKKIEKDLMQSNQNISEILDSIQDDFYVLDRNWNYIFVSKKHTSRIGKEPEDFIGNNIWKMFPKHVGTDFEKNLRITMEKRVVRRFIVSGKYTDAWYRMTVFPTKEGISVLGIEITEQIKTEEALRNSEEKFNKAFSSNPAAIAITTLDEGIFLDVNETWERLEGYKREEVIGKSARLLSIWPSGDAAKKFIDELKRKGYIRGWEQEFRTKSGKTYTAQLSSQILNMQGKQVIISTLVDISGRKELEKRKDEFISIASHELKTPITSLKGFTQIIEKHLKESGDNSNYLLIKRMGGQIERLTSLVSDLLDVTKIQSGKLLLPKETFDINQLTGEIISDISETIGKGFDIIMKGKIKKKVSADRFRIGQVITNILTNAIKFSTKSKKIIVTLASGKKYIQVSVRDFGVGIPKKEQAHMFERFFQAHAARNQEGRMSSLGLGLYISSEIIKRHGGKIWVDSNEGQGSTFYFTLPVST